jgi:hypothetical protein
MKVMLLELLERSALQLSNATSGRTALHDSKYDLVMNFISHFFPTIT